MYYLLSILFLFLLFGIIFKTPLLKRFISMKVYLRRVFFKNYSQEEVLFSFLLQKKVFVEIL